MGKICRVKQRTKTSKKGKLFLGVRKQLARDVWILELVYQL